MAAAPRMRTACVALLGALLMAFALPAPAQEIQVREASLRSADEGLLLDLEFSLTLNPRLTDAVAKGVPLYFVIEFNLSRPRWYWLDEKTTDKRLELRLSYHALSRQYRVSSGLLQQDFPTLNEALNILRRVRDWLVVERSALVPDASYQAAVRMRLDATLLPKPIQVSALTSRDWVLESTWKQFSYRAPQQLPAPVEAREPKQTGQQ